MPYAWPYAWRTAHSASQTHWKSTHNIRRSPALICHGGEVHKCLQAHAFLSFTPPTVPCIHCALSPQSSNGRAKRKCAMETMGQLALLQEPHPSGMCSEDKVGLGGAQKSKSVLPEPSGVACVLHLAWEWKM